MDEALHLDGVVGWHITASSVREEMALRTGDVPIEMRSPGGRITEGIGIMNIIRNYKKGKTSARISYAASMMSQIAMACDEVGIYDNGIFMIHNAQGDASGDHNEQRKQADLQERMSNMLAQAYVKKTGLSLEVIKKMMDENTYLFGQEAVDLGFADYLIETDEAKDKVVAMAFADELFAKGMLAIKEEALDSGSLEANLKLCSGIECSLGASPTVVTDNKSNTTHQGADMAEKSLLQMLQEKIGFKSDTTEVQAVAELEATLKASNDALDVAKTALATQTEATDALTVKLAEAEKFKAEAIVRLQEAAQSGVSAEVALAMVNADSAESASALVIEANTSTGGTNQSDTTVTKGSGLLAYAEKIKGSVKP